VTDVKKQIRIAILVVAATAVLFLAATNVIATPGTHTACSVSGCHDDPTGMTISASPTTVTVERGENFNVVINVDGISGQDVLHMKFPSQVADNAQFTYGSFDSEGSVDDGGAADLNSAADQLEVNYTITAPDTVGTYTLTAYAAQHTPHSTDVSITVNVIPPSGPGPSILFLNGTPSIPIDTQQVVVSANVTSSETITGVTLQYSLDNGTSWTNVTMSVVGQLYQGAIPQFDNGTHVVYRVVAVDNLGEETISWQLEYTVGNFPTPPPEPIVIPQAHFGWYIGAPALVIAYVGIALEYYDEERFTKIHGMMLGVAYIMTSVNVCWLFFSDPAIFTAMAPQYLINLGNIIMFVHSWHIWLGIISMILGTLAFITHLGGWKTCNLGLPAVVIWTILGFTGLYLGVFFRM
jgi:hypothetical protein